MNNTFNTREDVILALIKEFGEKIGSFNANPSRQRFWTFNRLFHYYWDLKYGRKETYRTIKNTQTGFYELKK